MTDPVNNLSGKGPWANGVLPVGGVQVVNLGGCPMPASLTVTSVAAGREIALSLDGTNYFVPQYDANPAAFLLLGLLAPAASVRFTGTVGDAWSVR